MSKLGLTIFVALPLVATAVPAEGPGPKPQPFAALTNNRREFANLNVETVRGVLWSSVDGLIYGLNTHGSQLIVHTNFDGVPDEVIQTLSLPVAMAETSNRILVVGGGTHALAVHDRATRAIVRTIQLPSEPADIVVDPDNNLAFIACQGANQLVKINLGTMTIAQLLDVASERPRFLFFDRGVVSNPADNQVYVAPFASGNNSIPLGPAGGQPNLPADQLVSRILDLDPYFPSAGLPDQDLYVTQSQLAPGTLQAVLRGSGTLLGPHGRPPWATNYWMFNVESRNKNPAFTNEPALNGQFAFNRLSIGQPQATVPLPAPTTFVDIDSIAPVGAAPIYGPTTSLSFPFGLAFHPAGIAAMSASMSDKIGIFDASGNRLRPMDIPLDPGSIPRHLQFDPFLFQYLIVHCWGTNVLEIWSIGGGTLPTLNARLGLGFDPTPRQVREGRTIWYDADRSSMGRTSCNTCHPGGKSDFLVWSLSDPPHDHKDSMVTQSLLSIEDTFPYHWRGERDLRMFNGAFVNLLGGTQTLTTAGSDPQFDKFQAFVFSLQAHANPLEDASRMVVDSGGQPAGVVFPGSTASALNGQNVYLNTPSGGGAHACNVCHTLPTSSSNDFQLLQPVFVASQTSMEVPHLRELTHRDRPVFTISGNNVPRNGAGITHSGVQSNLATSEQAAGLPQQAQNDVLAFIRQLDNGLAPAAHLAYLLTPAAQDVSQIQYVLQPQAVDRWIDVVAFGRRQPALGAPSEVRWLYNPATNNYTANETGLFPTPLSLSQLAQQAANGGPFQSIAVLGLPPGDGLRFALDPDNDALLDALEPAPTAQVPFPRHDSDFDNDNWPDGYEAMNGTSVTVFQQPSGDNTPPTLAGIGAGGAVVPDFVSTSVAKFFVTTSEDAFIEATFSAPGLPVRTYRSSDFARVHTVVLQGLEGSTPTAPRNYTATFTARDRAGLATPPALTRVANFTSRAAVNRPTAVGQPTFVVRNLTTQRNLAAPPNTVDFTSTFTIEPRDFAGATAPPSSTGHVIAAQVLIKRSGTTFWTVSNNFTSSNGAILPFFSVNTSPLLPYLVLSAPYILSAPTGTVAGLSSNQTRISIVQPGLLTGDQVALRVRTIMLPASGGPANTFQWLTVGAYQMPATDPAQREYVVTY